MNITPTSFSAYQEQTKNLYGSKKEEALKGFLLNNNIKRNYQKNRDDFSNFDIISNKLLIPSQTPQKNNDQDDNTENKSFNIKNAIKPLLIATGVAIGALLVISSGTKMYSNHLIKDCEPLPADLPRSMNLVEEMDLAIFRALREPNAKNVLGMLGVALMSTVTLISKNFLDGTKDIWKKKQECDINRDFQENLISVEAQAFSGKLNVVNEMLTNTADYFKKVFSENENQPEPLSFKGSLKEGDEKESNNPPVKKDKKTLFAILGTTLGFVGLSALLFSNYKKTVSNLDIYKQKMTHGEILSKINSAVESKDINALESILKSINAKEETMREYLGKITNSEDLINDTVSRIKKSQIYAQAPEALAGVSEKIQYYCFVDEPKGHLYNWILNPENKFNKYLFLTLSASSIVSYISKLAFGAIKDIAVTKENTNSELELRKRLVDVEIQNFKAKKQSAVNPLLDNFNYQMKQGKPKEELRLMAENILLEIKNGPPYVYS